MSNYRPSGYKGPLDADDARKATIVPGYNYIPSGGLKLEPQPAPKVEVKAEAIKKPDIKPTLKPDEAEKFGR